jgi:polysaccharide export outer membrane protein
MGNTRRAWLKSATALLLLSPLISSPLISHAAPGPAPSSDAYVLEAGDKIKLTVYDEDELSGQYTVSPTGMISIPLAGDVSVGGASLAAAQETVKHALEPEFLKDARVTIELLTLRPFFILGEVEKPGQYTYATGLTVLDAVATAGGFTYRANTHKVMIKHAAEDQETAYRLTASIPITAGDTIRILERHF